MSRPKASARKAAPGKAPQAKATAPKASLSRAALATLGQSAIRLGVGAPALLAELGPLRDLPGNWTGRGFDLIWHPFDLAKGLGDHFLQLNLTEESLQFRTIDAP